MKKLDREQLNKKARLARELAEAASELENGISDFNDAFQREWERSIDEPLKRLNKMIEEAVAFRDEVVQVMTDYADERSENWAESEAGRAFELWKEEWEGLELDTIALEPPEEISVPDVAVKTFENLSEEC